MNNPFNKPELPEEFFENKNYDEVELIERLTKKIGFLQQNEGSIFIPHPFLDSFDSAITILQKMNENITQKINLIAEEIKEDEQTFKAKLTKIHLSYQEQISQIQNLNKRIERFTNSMVQSGDRLQIVDTQRENGLNNLELIRHFSVILNLDPKILEGEHSKEQLLNIFLTTDGTTNFRIHKRRITVSPIDNAEINFTNEDRYILYEKSLIAKKLYAISLDLKDSEENERLKKGKERIEIIFNVIGEKIVHGFKTSYKNNDYIALKEFSRILFDFNGGKKGISIYISHIPLNSSTGDIQLLEKPYDRENTKLDPRIEDFFRNITSSLEVEYNKIRQIFPDPVIVMKQLIENLFTGRIINFIENVLNYDKKQNMAFYLHSLSSIYQHLINGTEGEIKYFISRLESFGISFDFFLNIVEKNFVPYKDSYIGCEIAYLGEIFKQEFERSKKATPSGATENIISLEVALNFMHTSKEAVQRCALLSPKELIFANMETIFDVLLKFLGREYVLKNLEKTVETLPVVQTSNKIFTSISGFLEMVFFINQIVMFLQEHFHVNVLPHVELSNEAHSMQSAKDSLIYKLEDKINIGIEKSVQAILSCIEKILMTQNKKAFRLKETSPFQNQVTPTCQEMVTFLKLVKSKLETHLDGKNLVLLLEHIGQQVFKLLMNHIKKFRVKQGLGAVQLLRDLTEYKDIGSIFGSATIVEQFSVFPDIANLHLVDPETLKRLISESKLSKLDKQEIIDLVKMRSDFKPFWVGKYL